MLCEVCEDILAERSVSLGQDYVAVEDVLPQHTSERWLRSIHRLTESSNRCLGCQFLGDSATAFFDKITAQYPHVDQFEQVHYIPGTDMLTATLVFPGNDTIDGGIDVYDASFECYTSFEGAQSIERGIVPWKAVGWSFDLEHEALTESRLQTIKLFQTLCTSHHQLCETSDDVALPTRVLQIERGTTSDPSSLNVKLIETEGAHGRYFALSHCWGDPSTQPLKTLRANIAQMKQDIPLDSLPRSFRDAIQLTNLLGIQYLWIDSLCIIQDDADDWAKEGAQMTAIYRNSFLTIAAANASNSQAGFLRSRPVEFGEEAIQIPIIHESNGEVIDFSVHVRKRCHPTRGLDLSFFGGSANKDDKSTLSDRAWCFQEHILPHRVIEFLEHEIAWTCNASRNCECRGILYQRPGHERIQLHRLKDLPIEEVNDAWQTCVSEYSSRKLTYFDDRLTAISGVARFFAEEVFSGKVEVEYIAGLWRHSMIDNLQWLNRHGPDTLLEWDKKYSEVAPSWSWASKPNKVNWYGRGGEHGDFRESNKASFVDLLGDGHSPPNIYGRLQSGSLCLVLYGFIMPIKVKFTNHVGPLLLPPGFNATHTPDTQEAERAFYAPLSGMDVIPDYRWQSMGIEDGQDLMLFMLVQRCTGAYELSNCMLILERFSEKKFEDNPEPMPVYRRIGYAICTLTSEADVWSRQSRDFVIVA